MFSLSIHAYQPPVNAGKIVRIEASINYSKIFFAEGSSVIVPRVLKWFEHQLASSGFVRVHRSHLVNKAFVEAYVYLNEKPHIGLRSGEALPISRRKHPIVLKKLTG